MADAAPPAPGPIPIDRATALTRALDAGDLAATMGAIQALAGGASSTRELSALARAATHRNDTVAVDALLAIGGTDASAAALKSALEALDEPRRAELTAMALEMRGPAFAALLR